MQDFLNVLLPSTFILFVLIVLAFAIGFCWRDAKQRGKSPILVCLLVFCSFPLGLIVWLLFRPNPVTYFPNDAGTYVRHPDLR
jgi:hypothetical protein